MAKKKSTFPLPKNDVQVNEYITRLAEAKVAAEKALVRANEKIAAINATLAEEVAVQEAIIAQYSAALFAYFEANRDALTDSGKRQSCAYATGVLGNRWTPPRTKFTDEKAIEKFVVAHRMTEFFEEKIVLRRDAMLANQARARTIPGVSFVRDRIIYVKPDVFDVEIELKKKIEDVS